MPNTEKKKRYKKLYWETFLNLSLFKTYLCINIHDFKLDKIRIGVCFTTMYFTETMIISEVVFVKFPYQKDKLLALGTVTSGYTKWWLAWHVLCDWLVPSCPRVQMTAKIWLCYFAFDIFPDEKIFSPQSNKRLTHFISFWPKEDIATFHNINSIFNFSK